MKWFDKMKPYYQDSHVTIYHKDCRDMAEVRDGSVQTLFADPDFNVGKRHPSHKDNRTNYYGWCEEWISTCFCKLGKTGAIYLMTIPRHLARLYPLLDGLGVFINEIHWRNVSAAHSKRGFWNTYQPILFYGKTKDYLFNTYAETRKNMERWTEWFTGAKGQMQDYWDDIPFVYAGSIRHEEAIMKPMTNEKAHPCQMPLALARRCILFSSNESDMTVDPFLGTGTFAFAAKQLNRCCIGYEIEEKYCEIAANRCRQMVMELEV